MTILRLLNPDILKYLVLILQKKDTYRKFVTKKYFEGNQMQDKVFITSPSDLFTQQSEAFREYMYELKKFHQIQRLTIQAPRIGVVTHSAIC